MNPIADHAQRIANLEAKVNNILQEGIVTKVREDVNLVDIEVRGVQLVKVPYLTWRTGDGKSYWLPDAGESGMLLCPDGQAGNAVFLPAPTTGANPAPLSDTSKFRMDFGNKLVIDVDNGLDSIVSGDAYGQFHVARVRNRDAKYELKNKSNPNTPDVTRTTDHDKIKDEVGIANIEITSAGVSIELSPTVKIDLALTGITITSPLVNVIGVLQVGGVPLIVP